MSRASTSWRYPIPEPGAAGSIRSARVALNGFVLSGELRPVMFVLVLARMISSASPTRAGRSMQTVGRLAEVRRDAVVALEGRLDDLLLDLAVERDRDLVAGVVLADVDERVLLGELGEGRAERALLLGSLGEDDGFERRARERAVASSPGRRVADRVTDADRAEPRRIRHLACRDDVASRCAGRGEDPDRRRLGPPRRRPARAARGGACPPNRRTYATRSPEAVRSILKTRPETGASGSPRAPARSSSTPASSSSDADPERGGAEEDRMDHARDASARPAARAAAGRSSAASSPTYARRIASSCSARTSVSVATMAEILGAERARRSPSRRPASWTSPIGTSAG